MSRQVFVDESKRHGRYIVAAAIVDDANLVGVGKALRQLRMPGQGRVHFAKEQDRRRRELVGRLARLPVTARIYTGRGAVEPIRAGCLRRLVHDLAGPPTKLVLEQRGPDLDRADLTAIAAALREAPPSRPLRYEHLPPNAAPALWFADALAWCYGAGGGWYSRFDPMVAAVVDVGPDPRTGARLGPSGKRLRTARSPGSHRPEVHPGSLPRPSGRSWY